MITMVGLGLMWFGGAVVGVNARNIWAIAGLTLALVGSYLLHRGLA